MGSKNKQILLFQRLFIWILYLFAGFILYTTKGSLYQFLNTFAKIIYPLSIFWLQIRLKSKGNFFPIDSTMSTAQLWFNLLPVFASLLTIIIVILNLIFYLTFKLI